MGWSDSLGLHADRLTMEEDSPWEHLFPRLLHCYCSSAGVTLVLKAARPHAHEQTGQISVTFADHLTLLATLALSDL